MMQSSITMSRRTSDESASSDVDAEIISDGFSQLDRSPLLHLADDEETLLRKAEMYQDFMKQVPIPTNRGSVIPFSSWVGLSISIKQLYGQPLHYLTNLLLQRWDQSRIGSDSEHQDLDLIIHPCKAESNIWLIEEMHRLTPSHRYLARLWKSDPMYYSFIDPVSP